ncbi:MAG: UbiA family prenyltransferase [Phycisphaerales bacterium JB063]
MNLRALLELMRVSNLPTVWSNAWMGWLAGLSIVSASGEGDGSPWVKSAVFVFGVGAWLSLAMSMVYTGGMVMNDYVDRAVDAKERPGRPIPSGRVRAGSARSLALVLLAGGFALTVVLGRWWCTPSLLVICPTSMIAGALVLTVVLYNMLHQRHWLTVLLMGGCRGWVVLACASVALGEVMFPFSPKTWRWVVIPALVLLLYTLAISLVARREVDPERGGFGGPKTVMNMIAAMPLLDALWLVAMGLWPASLVCVACAVLTKLGHRRIAGS